MPDLDRERLKDWRQRRREWERRRRRLAWGDYTGFFLGIFLLSLALIYSLKLLEWPPGTGVFGFLALALFIRWVMGLWLEWIRRREEELEDEARQDIRPPVPWEPLRKEREG